MGVRRWLLAGTLLLPTAIAAQVRACGVERWPVKVGVDRDVGRVDTTPVITTVSALRALPQPPRPLPYNMRIAQVELRTFRVRAILRQVLTEDDGDWHLVLEDPDAPGRTMIGEVPDANCALGSPYASRFDVVRRELRGAPRNAVVELTGLGFYDYIHGQRGVAPNGIELHPIIGARVVGRPAGVAADTSAAAVGETKVWVNTGSMVYHCPGTRYYGATKAGYYVTEAKAVAAGARPAYGRKCGP